MRGLQTTRMASPRSVDVMNGTGKEAGKAAGKDINQNTMTTVEITPVKAPTEIKNAIKRQKRTGNLDYIWQALPVTRSAKPLYKAVLRGSLQPGNVQYTITNVNGSEQKTSEDAIIPNANSKGSSHPVQNLSIAGLSINDIKFHEPSDRMSPRARLGPPTQYVSRHMKPTFLDQKNNNYTNGFVSRRAEYVDDVDFERIVSLKNSSLLTNCNGSSSKVRNSHLDKQETFCRILADEMDKMQSLTSSPESSSTGNAVDTHKSLSLTQDGTKHLKNNGGKPPNLSPRAKLGKTHSAKDAPVGEVRETNLNDNYSLTNLSIMNQTNSDNHPLTTVQKSSPRPTGANISQSKDDSVPGLSCIQLADSILGAVQGDLTQVYSLCQSKIRYSDFITQSHRDRLEEKTLDDNAISTTTWDSLRNLPERATTSLGMSHSSKSKSANLVSSASNANNEPTRLPVIKPSHKSILHQRTLDSFLITNRYMRIREPEIHSEKYVHSNDVAASHGKVGRPILKTFKSDVESSMNPNVKAKSNSFGGNSNINNRLVRFNTCHEVREFTPSEPIRQQ